jgi:virulence-associated protein VagC
MEQYMKVLKSFKRMKPELEKTIREIVKPVPVPSGTSIRKQGGNSGHVYFIEKGVAGGYFSGLRNKRINCFKKENDFIIVPKEKKGDDLKSVLVFEAIEDMTLWDFPDEQFYPLFREIVELNYYYRIIYTKGLVANDEFRHLEYALASEKLDFLRSYCPSLLDRVPIKYLASFVGVSQKVFKHMKDSSISLPLSGKHISLR